MPYHFFPPHWRHSPDHVERVCVALLAAGNLLVAVLVWGDTASPGLLPWPALFMISAVLLAAWAVIPGNKLLYSLSGSVSIGAYLGRAVAIGQDIVFSVPAPGTVVGATAWALVALLSFVVWRRLAPLGSGVDVGHCPTQ